MMSLSLAEAWPDSVSPRFLQDGALDSSVQFPIRYRIRPWRHLWRQLETT